MKKQLEQCIVDGRFKEAKAIYEQLDFNVFSDVLLEITFDNLRRANYLFVEFLLHEKEQANLHDLAYLLMSQPLCHLDRAYFIAYDHAKRAAELTDYADALVLENLLFLNIVPDQVVGDEEAEEVVQKILAIDARNVVANEWMKERK